jgi:hypothetical protein
MAGDNGPMNLPRAKVAGVVASALLIVATFASGASAAGRSAATRLLASALQDASAKGSVHEVGVAVSGRQKVTLVDDIATHEGRQDVNHYGNEQAHVLVVDGTAYLSGNRAALIGYFGFSTSAAHKIGSLWVSVPAANRNYAELSVGLTLASALSQLAPPAPLSETAPTTIDGQSVIGIRGTPPKQAGAVASSILYVSRSQHPLPVRLSVSVKTNASTVSSTVDLSGWGEHVSLTPPSDVVPMSST